MKRVIVFAVIAAAAIGFLLARTRGGSASGRGTAAADCSTLTFLTESLSDFPVNQPANFQIEGIGGNPPYRFELVDGTLPAGLHLNSNGKITGKPTEITDTTIFVRLTDSNGCQLTQAFALRVT